MAALLRPVKERRSLLGLLLFSSISCPSLINAASIVCVSHLEQAHLQAAPSPAQSPTDADDSRQGSLQPLPVNSMHFPHTLIRALHIFAKMNISGGSFDGGIS
jgi:hypothetical protein